MGPAMALGPLCPLVEAEGEGKSLGAAPMLTKAEEAGLTELSRSA